MPISFDEAVKAPAEEQAAGSIGFQEALGIATPERNIFQRIGDFVSDSGEQKKFAGTVGKVGLAAADMILGIPGQAVGVGANLGARSRALLGGESRKTQEAAGAEAQSLVPEWMVTPLQSIAKSLGMQEPLDQSIVEHILTTAGDKVEKYTRGALSTQDTKDLFNTVMLAGGAKGVDVGVKMALAPKAKGSSAAEARSTYAEDAPVESVATILRPEPVVVESPGQVKALFDTAKKNRPPEVSDVAAVETLFAKARSKGLAQIGPKSPYEAIAESKARIEDAKRFPPADTPRTGSAEGLTLEQARAKVDAEKAAEQATRETPLTELGRAITRLREGEARLLTAEEKIALDHSIKVRDGQLLDHNGRPFERGAVDPDLLKGILLAGGVAAYVATHPEAAEQVAWISGGALAIKGKGPVTAAEIFKKANPTFEKSRVSSADGTLLPLYHGGKALETGMPSQGYGLYGEGLYLTGRPVRANGYAGGEGRAVYPAYVNLENPISSDLFMERFGRGIKTKAEARQITEQLKAEGYDGVLDKQGDYVWEAVVFEPTSRVKSALSGVTKKEQTLAKDAILEERMQEATQERGSADPELLAKIAAGTAAGAYLLSSGNAEQGLAAMGLGLAMSMKGAPESTLLAAAREGGPKAQAAFTELYRQNVKQAERTLQSKFGRQNVDIEGALQDGMTSALAAVAQGTFRGDSKFSTFLHTAVVNKALNQLEAQRVRPDTVSLTEDPVTGRSGLAETLGHNETPANIALNKGLGKQIEAAMAKIDPRFREAFLAIEADGMSYEAAAEKFGVPVGTIRSRVSRAKEALQGYLRDYKDGEAGFDEAIPNRATGTLGSREGGAADPRTLTAIAGVTGGAVVGSLMNPENSLRNGLYGALAGGLLGTAAGRAAMKSAIESPRNALGVISTELANIHHSLRLKLVEHEYRVLKNTEQVNDQVLPFLTALKKLSKPEAQRVDNALRNGDLQELGTTPEIRKTYAGVRRALDFVEGELKALGRFGEGVSEYFPRLVKDIEGLKAAIGSAHATGLEAVLKKANAKMIKKEGRTLTDVEESIVVNRYLFAPDQTSFQPGYAKGRRLERIPDELQQFYEPSSESLLRYISGAVADIEKAKFFGRDLQTKTQGGKIFTDLDSSIGNLTARLLAEGKIDKAQAMEVRRLLKARFEQGDKAMDPRLAGVRNVTNAALLGNIASAATQIGDPLFAAYHHGLVPTLQAMTESLVGKSKVTPKQLGLINHVAEELSEMGLTGRMLHETMKWSGFKAIDMFGKETHLNAALLKWKQKLATPQGVAAFRAKYGDAFPEIDRVMQEVRNRKITPDTELLSFFELSDAQPISKAEMPAAYLNNPNGRILYQLKTYMVKQADIVRRDAYQEIAKGTPEGIMRGAKNLAALGTMYALANVPGDVIKDWLAGRPVDPLSTPKLVENVLQTFGLNRYTQDKLQRGQIAETAIGMATPPVRVLQDIAKMDARSVSYVPGVGRTVYERYLGGNERKKIAEMKARKLQLRNEAEARDPGLKAARLLRERERKDRALRAARELR